MTLSTKKSLLTAVVSVLVFGSVAVANNVTLPNVFQPNTPARAAEVNANFTAVKAAVDDSQTQLNALNARSGVRLFRKAASVSFPASSSTALQRNQVDVFLGTVASAGVFEVRLDMYDVNAFWSVNPEWSVSMTPVINGTAGAVSYVAYEFFGRLLRPPLSGSTTFAVAAGQSVSVRVVVETTPACSGSRGAGTTCEFPFYLDARFSPGISLE